MTHIDLRQSRAVIAPAVAALLLLALTGCKGRTMDNMEPTGETVEVVIDTVAPPAAPVPVDTFGNAR